MRNLKVSKTRFLTSGMFLLLSLMVYGVIEGNTQDVLAATTEWKSDFQVGFLEPENSEYDTNLKISTISTHELKLEWQEPTLSDNLDVVGYKIFRKTINSDYITIIENTNSTETIYVDSKLSADYYGYKIVPIIENKPADKITMHGINRNHNMFDSYLLGQELVALNTLNEILNEKSIQKNSMPEPFTYEYDFLKRSEDPILQKNISNEIIKAQKIFYEKFIVAINH